MKTLPTEFTKKGFTYTQIRREGSIALFWQSKGSARRFEVIRIQTHGAYKLREGTPDEVEIPAGEAYPSSGQWGQHGWTFRDPTEAANKFNALVAQQS